jgi:plastocyanin
VASGGTIHLENSTPSTLHTFVITGHGTDIEIAAGSSQDVKIDLPPGTYPFVCRIHEALGMKGTLIVG